MSRRPTCLTGRTNATVTSWPPTRAPTRASGPTTGAPARTTSCDSWRGRSRRGGGPDRQAIRNYLVKVGRGRPAFDGVTGAIVFDERGDVAGKTVTIGVVQDGRLVTERAR